MNDSEIAWVAGLLEGEGSFVKRSSSSCAVSCQMTDEDVIKNLHSLTGIGSVYFIPSTNPKWKDTWKWQCTDTLMLKPLLQQIYPFMGNRRKAAIDILFSVINSLDQIISNRLSLYDLIKNDKALHPSKTYRTLARQYNTSRSTIQRALR